jgi:hypothetical protein
MLTGKDVEILDWIGRVGAAGAEHVTAAVRDAPKPRPPHRGAA